MISSSRLSPRFSVGEEPGYEAMLYHKVFLEKVHSGTFSIVTFRRPSDAIFQFVNTISQEEQHLVGTCGALAYQS